MGVKFSVGVSDGQDDRQQLEELRRRSPAQRGRAEQGREPRTPGWPVPASSADDESLAGQPVWAW